MRGGGFDRIRVFVWRHFGPGPYHTEKPLAHLHEDEAPGGGGDDDDVLRRSFDGWTQPWPREVPGATASDDRHDDRHDRGVVDRWATRAGAAHRETIKSAEFDKQQLAA